ncbi:MAG: hypothetical protein ACM3NH_04645 [Candidatus Saccharibacteria bacterium]
MKEVTIKVEAEFIRVWVDGTRITSMNGSATVKAKPGSHVLSWVARGPEGTKYSVEIGAPKEAELKRGDTFDDDKLDAGVAWFKVNE